MVNVSIVTSPDFRQMQRELKTFAVGLGEELTTRVMERGRQLSPRATGYMQSQHGKRYYGEAREGEYTWLVYADTDYAVFVHDGTVKMLARPWLWQAVIEAQKRLMIKAKNSLVRKLESVPPKRGRSVADRSFDKWMAGY